MNFKIFKYFSNIKQSVVKPLPTYQDVLSAAKRLEGVSNKTPIMTSSTINKRLGAEIFFKCENFQKTGAFKFRGAYNALSKFTQEQKKGGVVTFSSGNHAQAIAHASYLLEISSTIVFPKDGPQKKLEATKGYSGQVILYDRYTEDNEAIVKSLSEEKGMTIIPPYDHQDIIAGQGTVAKEIFEEVGELDYLFVCLGGGGLISGCSITTKALYPNCKVYGVEPEAGNDALQSIKKGEIVSIPTPKTIADGAQTNHIGCLNFRAIKQNVEDIITVTDEQLVECMKFFAERMKLYVEPSGCLALAGLIYSAEDAGIEIKGKKIGIIISGGNYDFEKYSQLINQKQ